MNVLEPESRGARLELEPPPTSIDRELPARLPDVPRVLGRFGAAAPGPLLLVVASLHGNEPAGVLALRRVLGDLEQDPSGLAGDLLCLSGNRRALALGQRFVKSDLNRIWVEERLERPRQEAFAEPDELELWELADEIHRALAAARGPVFLLDLHTTSAPGPAFAVFDDTLPNRRFALHFPVPLVLGIEEEIDGTLANYLSGHGVTSVGFEAGRHRDPASVERAEAGIWIALEATGVIAPGRPEVSAARARLETEHRRFPKVVEVRYRHPVVQGDGFRMRPGFDGFDTIERGQVLGSDHGGDVPTPEGGRVLMPLYQALGDDGFFVVRSVRPAWLAASAVLRRLRLERALHLLPGVEHHPQRPSAFVVDRKIARWIALELFHLLGFRRVGAKGRFVTMARRDFDPKRTGPRR